MPVNPSPNAALAVSTPLTRQRSSSIRSTAVPPQIYSPPLNMIEEFYLSIGLASSVIRRTTSTTPPRAY
ncbi:transcription factor [Lysobacter enzymogenes]|uniref:Transcription factor n=1 Tax=Lysobacter enzymogenes TaxID=69 RepID=A0A0S2DIQ0_LYSEN|nr:transcription factor [Lysobacter enzymogenes]